MTNEFITAALKAVTKNPKKSVKVEELISALSLFQEGIKLVSNSESGSIATKAYDIGGITVTIFCLDGYVFDMQIYERSSDGYVCIFESW